MITWEKIVAHTINAKNKHPKFADRMCLELGVEYYEKEAKRMKTVNERRGKKGNAIAENILDAEMQKVYAEALRGNKERAESELLDAIAVLIRMSEMLEAKE